MIQLRDYQWNDMVVPGRLALRDNDSVCIVAPTGAGKTVVTSWIAESSVYRGCHVLVITHKGVIQNQMMRTFDSFGLDYQPIISGRKSAHGPLQVAMVKTLSNRLETSVIPDVIITDECHHTINGNQWGNVISYYRNLNPNVKVIGLTATPQGRVDGFGLNHFFKSIVQGPSLRKLINNGWLSDLKMWNPAGEIKFKLKGGDYDKKEQTNFFKKKEVIGDVIDHYRWYLDGEPTLLSCSSLEHANDTAERYREYARQAGKDWTVAMVQGGKKHEKHMREALDGMATGSVQLVAFVDILGEGVDVPCAVGLQMLRKTTSLVNFLQFIGRILRPMFPAGFNQYTATAQERIDAMAKGQKPFAKLFDHVNNMESFGHPLATRIWGLEDTLRGVKAGNDTCEPYTHCERCQAVLEGRPKQCPECGNDLVAQAYHKEGKRTPREIQGILKQVCPEMANQVIRIQDLSKGEKFQQFKQLVKKLGDCKITRAVAKALKYNAGGRTGKDGVIHNILKFDRSYYDEKRKAQSFSKAR
jgi:superfamily II DNA or RNA helicase